MAYIDLQNDLPGIRGPMAFRPETAKPLNELAEILLHQQHGSLSCGDREMIGAFVSSLNHCFFCEHVHGAMGRHYYACDATLIDAIKADYHSASIPDKLKALLAIAGSVQKGGRYVTSEQIEQAKKLGATDSDIHDTVLIAAAFCMFNRYVDGLNTWAPQDPQVYADRAAMRAADGYANLDIHK